MLRVETVIKWRWESPPPLYKLALRKLEMKWFNKIILNQQNIFLFCLIHKHELVTWTVLQYMKSVAFVNCMHYDSQMVMNFGVLVNFQLESSGKGGIPPPPPLPNKVWAWGSSVVRAFKRWADGLRFLPSVTSFLLPIILSYMSITLFFTPSPS